MKLYIEANNECTRRKRAKERFGDWSADYKFSVKSVSLENNAYYSTTGFEVTFDAQVADIVYVLSLTYSTGDSFGTARGQGVVLAVFKNETLAYDAQRCIQANEDSHTFEFVMDDGTKQEVSNVAYGYFEHITSTDITQCLVDRDAQQDY